MKLRQPVFVIGRSNTGSITPATAADIAKSLNIKIYTIGVGTEGEAPFLVDSFFGKQYVYQKVDLDEVESMRSKDNSYFWKRM